MYIFNTLDPFRKSIKENVNLTIRLDFILLITWFCCWIVYGIYLIFLSQSESPLIVEVLPLIGSKYQNNAFVLYIQIALPNNKTSTFNYDNEDCKYENFISYPNRPGEYIHFFTCTSNLYKLASINTSDIQIQTIIENGYWPVTAYWMEENINFPFNHQEKALSFWNDPWSNPAQERTSGYIQSVCTQGYCETLYIVITGYEENNDFLLYSNFMGGYSAYKWSVTIKGQQTVSREIVNPDRSYFDIIAKIGGMASFSFGIIKIFQQFIAFLLLLCQKNKHNDNIEENDIEIDLKTNSNTETNISSMDEIKLDEK